MDVEDAESDVNAAAAASAASGSSESGGSSSSSSGADDVDGGTGDDEVTALGVNPWSMKAVLGSCPDFANARSLICKCIEDREPAHKLLMSSKFHAECAGVGIEYDFGRVKWYYKSTHAMSSDGLISGSLAAFSRDVVTLGHTRKFARKARDYMRAYRAGAKGLEADSAVKLLKTHRCMLDAAASFCSSDATVLCKDGYPRVDPALDLAE